MTMPPNGAAPGMPSGASWEKTIDSLELRVNRDNVLEARAALLTEADKLDQVLASMRNQLMQAPLCANDPVSVDASKALPERVNRLFDQYEEHNFDLRRAAEELAAIAHSYGYTEDEIYDKMQSAGATLPYRIL